MDVSYLAGLFDGEGWFGITFGLEDNKVIPRVLASIGMNDSPEVEQVFAAIKDRFGGYVNVVRSKSGKPHRRWMSGKNAGLRSMLCEFLPCSKVKLVQIQLCLTAIDMWLARKGTKDRATLLIDIAVLGDRVAAMHARQIPRKWDEALVRKYIEEKRFYGANQKMWSPYVGCCRRCNRSDRRHVGRGLCKSCYNSLSKHFRRLGVPPNWEDPLVARSHSAM